MITCPDCGGCGLIKVLGSWGEDHPPVPAYCPRCSGTGEIGPEEEKVPVLITPVADPWCCEAHETKEVE